MKRLVWTVQEQAVQAAQGQEGPDAQWTKVIQPQWEEVVNDSTLVVNAGSQMSVQLSRLALLTQLAYLPQL